MRFRCGVGVCNPFATESSEFIVACGNDAEYERMKNAMTSNPPKKLPENAIRSPPRIQGIAQIVPNGRARAVAGLHPNKGDELVSSSTKDEILEKEMTRITITDESRFLTSTNFARKEVDDDLRESIVYDYDIEKGELFFHLETRNWNAVNIFSQTYPEQVSYWISRKNSDGKLRWKMLPIHAAIIYDAPVETIHAILTAHPMGVAEPDDRGVHPLQLAYRLRRNARVINVLEEYYVHSKTLCWPMKEAESIAI